MKEFLVKGVEETFNIIKNFRAPFQLFLIQPKSLGNKDLMVK